MKVVTPSLVFTIARHAPPCVDRLRAARHPANPPACRSPGNRLPDEQEMPATMDRIQPPTFDLVHWRSALLPKSEVIREAKGGFPHRCAFRTRSGRDTTRLKSNCKGLPLDCKGGSERERIDGRSATLTPQIESWSVCRREGKEPPHPASQAARFGSGQSRALHECRGKVSWISSSRFSGRPGPRRVRTARQLKVRCAGASRRAPGRR